MSGLCRVFFPTLMTHTTLKMGYQIWEVPFCSFYRRQKVRKRIWNSTLVYKQGSCILPTTAPCLSLLLIQWCGLCCINDVWELQTISYSWLTASAFNKCLLCTYVTFWLPTLQSTCQDGIVPARECGPAAGAQRKSASVALEMLLHGRTPPSCPSPMVHMALGSHQPPDFQRTPALGSWLGFLVGHEGRSELASSRRAALAQEPLWPRGPCRLQAQWASPSAKQ